VLPFQIPPRPYVLPPAATVRYARLLGLHCSIPPAGSEAAGSDSEAAGSDAAGAGSSSQPEEVGAARSRRPALAPAAVADAELDAALAKPGVMLASAELNADVDTPPLIHRTDGGSAW
jgi:hypothetical protein